MFTWVKGNAYTLVATLYANNITLNQAAASYFQEVRWVMIGIDEEAKKIAIKPVTKHEIDLKLVALDQLHKVSIGKGYARISNKQIMETIAQIVGHSLDGYKCDAEYQEQESLLIINLVSNLEKG